MTTNPKIHFHIWHRVRPMKDVISSLAFSDVLDVQYDLRGGIFFDRKFTQLNWTMLREIEKIEI
jgi:hypothetical protein